MSRSNVGNERGDNPANDFIGDVMVKAEGSQPVIELLRIHSLPKERWNLKCHLLERPQIQHLPFVDMMGAHEIIKLRFKLLETG